MPTPLLTKLAARYDVPVEDLTAMLAKRADATPAFSWGQRLFSNKPYANSGLLGTVGNYFRNAYLGSPIDLYHGLKTAPGAHFKHHFLGGPRLGLGTALSLGMPAYSLYQAAKDPEHRAENVGSGLAQLAVSPITSQLGILGTPIARLAGRFGAGGGRVFHGKSPSDIGHQFAADLGASRRYTFTPTHDLESTRGVAPHEPDDPPAPARSE